jgi:hypothetical protein
MAGAEGVAAKTDKIQLANPKTYAITGWGRMSDTERLRVIRSVALRRGRDPRIATLVVGILKKAGVSPREYDKQAAVLLAWVQDPKNCYYVNEPGERLQDPLYTLKVGYGDCDDMALLLCSFFESIKLEWKLVISGRHNATKQKVRHVEGDRIQPNVSWSHIYCAVGTPPFKATRWHYCEPTLRAPLGWDVVSGDASALPEMGGGAKVPPGVRAMAGAYGSPLGSGASAGAAAGSAVASSMTESREQGRKVDLKGIALAVTVGVITSATTQIILEYWREYRLESKKKAELAGAV